jgi:hypothetical protein
LRAPQPAEAINMMPQYAATAIGDLLKVQIWDWNVVRIGVAGSSQQATSAGSQFTGAKEG